MEVLLYIGGFLALLGIVFLLDRWHDRYSWKKAHEEAARIMQMRYPDNKRPRR